MTPVHRRRLLAALAWGVLLGVLIVVRAPAHVVSLWLEKSCRQHCRMIETRGGLWQGTGRLLWRADVTTAWRSLGTVSWGWRWPDDNAALPALAVVLGDGRLHLQPGWRSLRIDAAGLSFPADLLLNAFAAHARAGLGAGAWQGRVSIEHGLLEIPWQAGFTSKLVHVSAGSLNLLWQGAGTLLLPGMRLGDYRLHAVAQPAGGWQARIDTADADMNKPAPVLAIDGNLVLSRDGTLSASLDATPRIPTDPQLTRLLSGFARRIDDRPGVYRWQWPAGEASPALLR